MKKINLLLLATLIAIFCACDGPENNENTIFLSGTASASDNGKTDISEQGKISWENDDEIYVWTGSSYDAYFNVLKQGYNPPGGSDGELDKGNYTSTFSGTIGAFEPISYEDLRFIHFKNYTSHMYDDCPNVKIHLGEQEGTLDNIGNYHISKVDNVNLNHNGGNSYTFSNICFKSHTSIACFDLSEYKEDVIKISYQNINNCYTLAYVPWFDNQINEKGTNGEITILYPSANTYVALLPQIYKDPESYGQESAYSMAPIENTIITFTNAITNEVIGTVTFPNGVQNGRLYTGPNFKPIKIGKRSTVVETEL